MENQFYKTVPVSESPEKSGFYFCADPNFPSLPYVVGKFDKVTGEWREDEDFIHPSAWLRPVPLTLPEEVSDDELGVFDGDTEDEQYAYECGAKEMRDTLSPAFASLQEEIRKLTGDVERWKRTADRHLKDCDSFIETKKELQEENEGLKKENGELRLGCELSACEARHNKALLESCEKALEERDAKNERLRAAVKKARGTLGYGELETKPGTIKSVREILDEAIKSK